MNNPKLTDSKFLSWLISIIDFMVKPFGFARYVIYIHDEAKSSYD